MSDEKEPGSDPQGKGDEWSPAMDEQAGGAQTRAVELDELKDESTPVDDPKLDVILDIPVTLSMEVGNTEIAIRNLLQLSQGSVIELGRMAGEPLDVKVNGTLIAHGEVVVVNERYGIRLTDVISPQERIKKLR
ncbi:flagellar motor switch protein FliN [Marinobacterium rhizophilum]|uniref:Flagellar motor switch protein FliN n=1 Tax=Marinobacterium rhizophilum TaxID=420402 RepID=A0ABY5HDW8_9GAMM|nr:flagellar motor switch protein FliN [Marinobacterium rhizophilum]UTW10027.1 flagellar motor switch protein FliN [Marinobacterium rhizophilum]